MTLLFVLALKKVDLVKSSVLICEVINREHGLGFFGIQELLHFYTSGLIKPFVIIQDGSGNFCCLRGRTWKLHQVRVSLEMEITGTTVASQAVESFCTGIRNLVGGQIQVLCHRGECLESMYAGNC